MTELYKNIRILFLFQLFCFVGTVGWSQNVNLKVVGNAKEGFNVEIYNGTKLLFHNTEEFNIKLANLDLSETIKINDWKGSEWTGNKTFVKLSKQTYLSDFDLN